MIRTILAQVQWGVEAMEDGGVQFTFMDPESKQMWHIPFSTDALTELLIKTADLASDEVKEQVKQHFATNGIVVPPANFDPSMIQKGPQG